MKKLVFITAGLIATAFSACTGNSEKDAYRNDVNDLTVYVDSVDKLEPVYTETQWAMIDDGYNKRIVKVEKTVDVDAEEKQKIEASKVKYQALKDKYEVKIREAKAPVVVEDRSRQQVRDQLVGTGKWTADNPWSFVTPQNIVSVYEDFVEKTRKYGDNYSDAEWVEAKALWNALNDKKDAIEKDISTKDNLKIAGLRVAYTAIKSVNRPVSKVKEEVKEKN